MNIATIISYRDTPTLVNNQVEQIRRMSKDIHNHIVVVDCGSNPVNKSIYSSYRYDDPDFRGKCYGHNIGLSLINPSNYDYIWFNQPDIDFTADMECLQKLIDVMENNPQIALLSPKTTGTNYPGKDIVGDNPNWHTVSTTDYLSLLIRGKVVKDYKFLNPEFLYSWGAIHEYCYHLYRTGWIVAYADKAEAHHLGSTTYGKSSTTVSKDVYRKEAKKFAREYFVNKYGKNWDTDFSKVLPHEVKINTFTHHRERWEQ